MWISKAFGAEKDISMNWRSKSIIDSSPLFLSLQIHPTLGSASSSTLREEVQ